MNISVVVCTHNRSQSLAVALESLASQKFAASADWEILVVDNNSTDNTREVAERFINLYPDRFRYIFEARQGKSYALNTGIENAQGDIFAFTDDDIVAEPTWLENLTSAFAQQTCMGVSGRTLPEKGFTSPPWLNAKQVYAMAPVAIFDLGIERHEINESPFGNNMAYRKTVFEKYGAFRVDLGPRAGCSSPQKNEDSEFGSRLLSAKEQLLYEPAAVIYHAVPARRIQQSYFLEWWFDKARADVQVFGIPASEGEWFVAGIPIRMFRRLLVWTIRWMVAINPAHRFECKKKVWGRLGEMKECHLISQKIPKRRGMRNAAI